jgi:hypothetical protein
LHWIRLESGDPTCGTKILLSKITQHFSTTALTDYEILFILIMYNSIIHLTQGIAGKGRGPEKKQTDCAFSDKETRGRDGKEERENLKNWKHEGHIALVK